MAVRAKESAFLGGLPFFYGLPQADLNVFMGAASLRRYKKHEYIYHQGDEADRFFVVADGWLRLYRETLEGSESVSDILTRADIFGEGLMFYQNGNYMFSAQAVEEAQIVEISKSVLRRRAEENPEILKRIMATVCEKIIRLQTENERLASMSATQRVACLLLRLSSSMLGKGGTFTFPYDKSLAAAQLGMKRETFSRALLFLREYGVTVNGAEVRIDSFHRLAAYSCKQCSLCTHRCAGGEYDDGPGKLPEIWARPQAEIYSRDWRG